MYIIYVLDWNTILDKKKNNGQDKRRKCVDKNISTADTCLAS